MAPEFMAAARHLHTGFGTVSRRAATKTQLLEADLSAGPSSPSANYHTHAIEMQRLPSGFPGPNPTPRRGGGRSKAQTSGLRRLKIWKRVTRPRRPYARPALSHAARRAAPRLALAPTCPPPRAARPAPTGRVSAPTGRVSAPAPPPWLCLLGFRSQVFPRDFGSLRSSGVFVTAVDLTQWMQLAPEASPARQQCHPRLLGSPGPRALQLPPSPGTLLAHGSAVPEAEGAAAAG